MRGSRNDTLQHHIGNRKDGLHHQTHGNPENAQTITISESAWPAHGDYIGTCPLVRPPANKQTNDPTNSPTNKRFCLCTCNDEIDSICAIIVFV